MKKTHKTILSLLLLCVNFVSFASAENQVNRLDDIVVTATKTQHVLEDVPVTTIVINQKDINRANAQNVMDLLKDIPGIQMANHDDVFGTYTWVAKMRGLDFNSGYALILIDGQRAMGCGQSGGMGEYGIGLNQIPVEMIDRIEIVKGPGSALYGSDAMAGVVNIITKKVPKTGMGSAGVSYGRYRVQKETPDGSIEKADGGARLMSKAYASYGSNITNDFGYFIHYNYEGADDIRKDPIKSWRHSFLGKFDASFVERLDLSLKTEISAYEKDGNREEKSYRVSAFADFLINPNQFLALKGYTYNWDFTHGAPGYAYGYKYGDVDYNQVELQYTWQTHANNTLVLGGEAQVQGISFTIENNDGSVISVKEDVKTSSLYIQDEATLFDTLTLVGGVRYDNHSVFGNEINPKFSVMYAPSDTTKIRASFGTSFKSPTIRQLYYNMPYRHGEYYIQSNSNLEPEKAHGYGVSVEQWFLDHNLMVDIGYFRNDVKNMVVGEDTGTLYLDLPLREYRNVEKAMTQGIELMCKAYFTDAFFATFSYTYTDTKNKETGNELTYISRHSASLSPSYRWEKYGFGISGRLSLNSKQYTNTANTSDIDKGVVLDAKMYKQLSKNAKLSLEIDDIFDSAPSRVGRYYSGRTVNLKFDIQF